MRIGEFIKLVQTTKDTVRHYEELDLIRPDWKSGTRDYAPKDLKDFQAIKEMQSMGLALKDIHSIFEIKRSDGCGSDQLIVGVLGSLNRELSLLNEAEKELKRKKSMIQGMMKELEKNSND